MMKELIELFLVYLAKERRYSEHTTAAYGRDLEAFVSYLKKYYDIDLVQEIQSQHVRSYIVHLNGEQQLKAKSIQRKVSSINSFMRHAMKSGLIQKNPLENIQLPKREQRLPTYLTISQVEELLKDDCFDEGYDGELERMIISLFILTGIRRGELISLENKDVDHSNGLLKVRGKGDKDRIIPLSGGFLKYVNEFLDIKDKYFSNLKEPQRLLHTPSGRPLYTSMVNKIVKKHLERITTLQKKSPHVLRHTFATLLSNEGARLQVVQELLGHASLSSTQIYTHSSLEQIRQQYLKAHPRGNKNK